MPQLSRNCCSVAVSSPSETEEEKEVWSKTAPSWWPPGVGQVLTACQNMWLSLDMFNFPSSQHWERLNRPLAVGHRRGKIINIQRAPLSTPALRTFMILALSSHLYCVVLVFSFFLFKKKKKGPGSWNWVNTSKSQLLLKAPSPNSCRGKSPLLKAPEAVFRHKHCVLLAYF